MTTYFTIESMIRGYHIYVDDWESSVGEQLFCEIEYNNRYASYAVVVVRTGTTFGRVIQNMVLIYTLFCGGGDLICVKLLAKDNALAFNHKDDWRLLANSTLMILLTVANLQ